MYYKNNSKENKDSFSLSGIADSIDGWRSQTHKRIREIIQEKDLYRKIFERSGDLIRVVNKEGIFEYISPSIKKVLGYEEDELLGHSVMPYVHPSEFKKVKQLLSDFNDNLLLRKIEVRWVHKSGKIIFLESICYFLLEVDNESYFVFNCRNITERKLQENKLKKLQIKQAKATSLFRKLSHISPDYITLWDTQKRQPVYANKKNPFGYNLFQDMKRLSSVDIIHEEDRGKVIHFRNELMNVPNLDPPAIEYRIKKKDGEWEWVNNRIIVMQRNALGFPVLLLASTSIITNSKEIERELEDSKSKILALLENNEEIIWSIDNNFILIAANSSFKEIFLKICNASSEVGKSIFYNSTTEEIERWKPLYEKALSGVSFTEVLLYEFNSVKYYYETSFTPIYSSNGIQEAVSCFCKDVTKYKQLENELKQSNFELDSFVFRASHDMLAPLKSILGLVNILRLELSIDEKEKYLGLVEKSVKKLDVFIHDLTSLSRNSRLPIAVKPIDFQEIIKDCLENLAYMENAKRLNVIIEIEGSEKFYSDRSRLIIVFQNFLSNAIKYQRLNIEHPEVLLKVTVNKTEAIIIIKDNGIGIKKEFHQKVFEMFFRASEDSYGSGIGLYIAKQAIEKLGGQIMQIDSEFGKGTTFTLKIPNATNNARE